MDDNADQIERVDIPVNVVKWLNNKLIAKRKEMVPCLSSSQLLVHFAITCGTSTDTN